MKISPISYNLKTNINFKAGKTQIFSDFDGTYFPYHQNILKAKNTHPDVLRMKVMQSSVRDFIADKRNKISFIITTGRSKAEMQYLLNNIGKNNIFFFAPEYFILRNGSEKCDVNKEENTLTLKKSQETESCLPKEKLMSEIISIIQSVEPNIKIFKDKINKIENDYDEESIEYAYKEADIRNKKYVSINVEDNGLTEIVFPFLLS